MSPSPPGRKAIWLLPIVIAICAVMVLPGGTFVASSSHAGNPMATSAGVNAATSAQPTAPKLPSFTSNSPLAPSSPGASAVSTSPPSTSKNQLSPSFSSVLTRSDLASEIPASLQNVPWVQDLLHPGVSNAASLASLPNLGALEHPAHTTNGLVYPGYSTQPAPLGLTDYGLGATPYSYNTSHMVGVVTFTAPPNVTQPAATNVIGTTQAQERLGYVGSEYEFGIQLNTIGNNLTIPGTYNATTNQWSGYVWAQNVVNWNDSGIHLIQDTWNFSLDSNAGWQYNSIYSGCGGNQDHANYILYIYGVFQCSEGNIPITAADYPVTLSIYNNFTTDAAGMSQLVYGYNVYEAGVGTDISGVADTVTFNNSVGVAPSNSPGNTINPFAPTPTFGVGSGFWQDSEIDIVGGIEGDNGVFSAINGSVQLEYSNQSTGGWQNVPSAYNFGSDTGETSTGIADYWTPGHVLEINQGPSMLYGLWNAEPHVSVASGDVHIGGTISPTYGFVFVSNTPPVLNPWSGTEQDNMSWLPTTSTGTFSTYLPPLHAPWTTTYYVQAFASGSAEYNGTVTASTSALTITLTAAPGVLRAPLYMSTAAQASALAHAVGGSASSPYTFSYLTVNVNFTFDHLNDWDFPTFEVFQTAGVNNVVVNNVYLGTDSYTSGNSYIWDSAPGGALAGFFVPVVSVFIDIPYYTSGIDVYFGHNDQVLNQELEEFSMGLGDEGAQVTLWGDTDALVNDSLAEFDYPGVFVGGSFGTMVTNTTAIYGYGVSDFGSTGTTVTNLSAEDALGVSTTGSSDGVYSWINVTDGGLGIEDGQDYGPTAQSIYDPAGSVDLTVNELNVTYYSEGANITFSEGTTFNTVAAYDPEYGDSQGLDLDGAPDTTVNSLVANYASGLVAWNTTDLVVNGLVLENETTYYWNTQISGSTDITLNDPVVYDTWDYYAGYGIGVIGFYDTGITVTDPYVFDMFGGIIFVYGSDFTGTNLASEESEFSYELDFNTATIAVNGVQATDDYIGLNLYNSYPATVKNVVATEETGYGDYYGGGVALFNDTGNTVTTVTSEYGSTGVKIDSGGSANTVSNVLSTSYDSEYTSVGVWIETSSGQSVTSVTAEDDGIGVELTDGAQGDTITSVSAESGATGVFEDGALANTISTVSADDAAGVVIESSTGGTISDVTSTFFGVGVIVDPSSDVSISDVTVAEEAHGVVLEGTTEFTVSTVSVTEYSVGVLLDGANDGQVSGVTLNDTSIGVAAYGSDFVTISGVTATGTSPALPPWDDSGVWDAPIAAVDTFGSVGVTITGVTATDYPAALYDEESESLTVTALNATGGFYGVVLNDTAYSIFTGIGAFHDYQGMLLEDDAGDNTITGSSFVDDTSYGVAIASGEYNTIYNNNFIADNGATATYNPAHIQALGNDYNEFYICTNYDCTTGVGNYWADWHTYGSNGFLAPYWTSGSSVDEFPIGPQETFAITFYENGLATGQNWSVTLSGMTQVTANNSITFTVPMGTYLYQVNNVAGYTVSPSSGGTITEAGAPYSVLLTFTAITYAVTLSESGLGSGTSWSATVNGMTQSTTGASLTFYLPAGTSYAYSFNTVSGYNLPATGASGTFSVTNAPVSLATTYSPTSTPSYVQTSDFNNWLGVAVALAVIALVIGLLALFLRRRKEPPTQGAQAWTPPPAQSGGGAPPASGGSANWSEGPPSGGSPPS